MARGEFSDSRREALCRETKENDEKTNAFLRIGDEIAASRQRTIAEMGRIASMLSETDDRQQVEQAQEQATREAKNKFAQTVEQPVDDTARRTERLASEASSEAAKATQQAGDVRNLAGSAEFGKTALERAASKLETTSKFNQETAESARRERDAAIERMRQIRASLDL